MKLTYQQRADLRALAERFLDKDLGLALSSGCLNLLADLEEASAEIPRLRQGLWDCFAAAGGDTDGDPTPVALVSDIVPLALECVQELRAELEKATATRGNGVLVPSPKLEEMQAELAATRQQLTEANQIKETVIAERADWMRAAYDLLEAIGEPLPPGATAADVVSRWGARTSAPDTARQHLKQLGAERSRALAAESQLQAANARIAELEVTLDAKEAP